MFTSETFVVDENAQWARGIHDPEFKPRRGRDRAMADSIPVTCTVFYKKENPTEEEQTVFLKRMIRGLETEDVNKFRDFYVKTDEYFYKMIKDQHRDVKWMPLVAQWVGLLSRDSKNHLNHFPSVKVFTPYANFVFADPDAHPAVNNFSFADLIDILCAHNRNTPIFQVTRFIGEKVEDPQYVKTIPTIIRYLEKVSEFDYHMIKSQSQIDKIAKIILNDPVLLDTNLKAKSRLLKLMTHHQAINQKDV